MYKGSRNFRFTVPKLEFGNQRTITVSSPPASLKDAKNAKKEQRPGSNYFPVGTLTGRG